MNIPVSLEAAGQFAVYAEELVQWNRRINLTAITDPLEIAVKHFLDSAAAAPWIPAGSRVLDIGSGPGFPGMVLKILQPDLDVSLIEAVRKKISFQRHVIRTIGLSGIQALHGRAEDMAGTDPNAFDVVICRALTDLAGFFQMARPLLAPGGMAVAMKGRLEEVEAEIQEMSAGELAVHWRLSPYTLPYLDACRTLAIHSLSKSSSE